MATIVSHSLSAHVSTAIGTDHMTVSEETIQKLRFLFPDELITAAFDLIDRHCGR